MPDIISLTTTPLPEPVKITPIRVSGFQVRKEKKKLEREYLKQKQQQILSIFDDFKKKYPLLKAEGIDPLDNKLPFYGYQYDTFTRDNFKDQDEPFTSPKLNTNSKWIKYRNDRLGQIYNKMQPYEKEYELSVGGAYKTIRNENPLMYRAFGDAANQAFSMQVVKPKDPIYGDDHKSYYRKTAAAGALVGEVLNYAAMAAIFKGTTLPAKIARMSKGGGVAAQIARYLGKPAYRLGQIRSITSPLMKLGGRYTAEGATEAMALNMSVMSFKNAVSETANEYYRQDELIKSGKLKEKDWQKLLLTTGRGAAYGLVSGSLLTMSQAPMNWPARFMGDAIWSTSDEAYRVMSGQQKGWDSSAFIHNFILGHVFGEIANVVSGESFFVKNVARNNFIKQQNYDAQFNEVFKDIKIDNELRSYVLGTLYVHESKVYHDTGKYMTPEQRTAFLHEVSVPVKRDYVIIQSVKYPNTIEIRDLPSKPLLVRGAMNKRGDNAVIDFTAIRQTLEANYGKNIAVGIINQAKRTVVNMVNEVNTNMTGGKQMYLKSRDENSLILSHSNMDDFENNVGYIANILENNYGADEVYKRFSVVVTLPDGRKTTITNFRPSVKYNDIEKQFPAVLPEWKQVNIKSSNTIEHIPETLGKTEKKQYEIFHKLHLDNQFLDFTNKYNHVNDENTQLVIKGFTNPLSWVERWAESESIFKKTISSFERWRRENFTSWEIQEYKKLSQPLISFIYKKAGTEKEIVREIDKIMSDFYEPTRDRIEIKNEKGEVIQKARAGLTTTQRVMLTNTFIGVEEYELKNIVDIMTGKTRINPEILKEPIRMKNGKDLNLDLYDKKSIITLEQMRYVKDNTKDPLALSKMLVQVYDVSPDIFVEFCQNYPPVKRIIQNEYLVKDLTLYQGTVDPEPFHKLQLDNREYLKKHLPEFDWETLDIRDENVQAKLIEAADAKGGNEAIEIRKSIYKYIRNDPDLNVYFPHINYGNDKNVKVHDTIAKKQMGNKPLTTKDRMEVSKKEFENRQFATLIDAESAGCTVETDLYKILWSTLYSLKTQNNNISFNRQLKEQWMLNWEAAKKTDAWDTFIEEHGGIAYKPSDGELKKIDDMIENKVDVRLKTFQKKLIKTETDKQHIEFLELEKQRLNEQKAKMNEIRDWWDSDTGKAYSDILKQNDISVPGNYHDFVADTHKPLFFENVKTTIERNAIYSSDIPGAEGLFFNRVVYKGLQQFVLRNNYLVKKYNYLWQDLAYKLWDKVNGALKAAMFIAQPLMMTGNAIISMAAQGPTAILKLPAAYREFMDNGEIYREARAKNLFNESVDSSEIFKDGMRSWYEVMGKNKMVGEMQHRWGIEKGVFRKLWAEVKLIGKDVPDAFVWNFDKVMRLASYMQVRNSFQGALGADIGALKAADWTNLFYMSYSRIPHRTRQMLGRVFLFPTYRSQTFRYHMEMVGMAWEGVRRVFGAEIDPRYQISKDKLRQAMFEISPLLRSLAMKTATKLAMAVALGFTYENIFDLLTGYREKRYVRGRGLMDSELQFLSFSTQIFEVEKILTRPIRVTLMYNLARFPGLIYAMATNTNIITGEPLIREKRRPIPEAARKVLVATGIGAFFQYENPHKALAQFGFNVLDSYMPLMHDIRSLPSEDVGIMGSILNQTGIAYYYKLDNPQKLMQDFKLAIDKAVTQKEHLAALNKYHAGMRTAYQRLFKEEYKDIFDKMQQLKENYGI